MVTVGVGKCAIVTGGSSGIGFEVAKALCRHNFDVTLTSRDLQRGQKAVELISNEVPAGRACCLQLDLTKRKSIENFVAQFTDSGKPLDLLINNAGMAPYLKSKVDRQTTEDGYEMAMGTNYIGHFLLTHLLLDKLKARAAQTCDVRVIIVSSSLHDPTRSSQGKEQKDAEPFSVHNMMLSHPGTYTGMRAYSFSKAALVMYGPRLARELHGTGVNVNVVCPGFVPATNLSRNAPLHMRMLMTMLVRPICWIGGVSRTVQDAASSVVRLAVDPAVAGATGKYYREEQEDEPAEFTRDLELQERLWTATRQLLGLDGEAITLAQLEALDY